MTPQHDSKRGPPTVSIKTLKFAPHLVPLVLSGKKDTTWRVGDEKNISRGDTILLVNKETGEEFTKAQVLSVKLTNFGKLSREDFAGHEPYRSFEEIKRDYGKYYKMEITRETELKVIKFKIF